VAQNFVSHVLARDGSWAGSQGPAVLAVEPLYHRAVLVAFVASVCPSGFVLVPAEDELPAVKAFSTTDNYKAGGDFDEWVGAELEEIVTALRADRAVGKVFAPTNHDLWNRFDVPSTRFQPRAEAALGVVSPVLLTSTWDQGGSNGSLYNNLCPQVGGAFCPVGCVATATSQVMHFWKYPQEGQGSHSYNWNGQTLSADFEKTYDWASMPDALSIMSPTAQRMAVATLCYDVAVAFEMDFAPDGSGAYTSDAQQVLPEYFKYSTDIKVKGYTGSDSSWFPYFTQQVDIQRPALLSIRGSSGGHAVVVDGYRTDTGRMVHINMGWGGMENGYYALNNIQGSWFSFKEMNTQQIIYDIHPPGEVTPPSVGGMSKAGSPFRFVVNGSNLVEGVQVFIGSDTAPWSSVTYKNPTKLLIGGGSSLKTKVPKATPTVFKFVNPDGGEATYTFTW
jgi:hypothetical protein